MSPKFPYLFFLFCCFSLNMLLNAQTENDSLAKYSYEELEKKFYDTRFTNKDLCKLYAEKYLSKAKLDGDKIKISRGYFHMTIFYYVVSDRDLTSIKYADSIVNLCKDCKDKDFPAIGYYTKGVHFYDSGKLKEALADLLKTLEVLKTNTNVRLEIDTRNAIIALKSNWSANSETLKYKTDLLDFIKQQNNYKEEFKSEYALTIINIAISYTEKGNYIKGLEIIKKAINEKIEAGRDVNYYDFVSLAGNVQYYLKNYKAAIDSLSKALPYVKMVNDRSLVMDYYYLAKSYDKLNQPEKAQFHFLKTDSIYQATKDIFPEMRNVYEHIIEYYKSKNDVKNQIKYYDRLIETDKIIDSTYTYVKETIDKKYETPQAIAERNRLLEEAQAKESTWKYGFGIIAAALVGLLGILITVFRRQKQYKQRFEDVMLNDEEQSKNISQAIEVISENEKTKEKDFGVPQEITENILMQLQKFETAQKFTKQISLTDLAKKLGTNPKYLSKVINGHYQKNFSSYINELRIEYVISKLKTDSKFRNYTIKAIGKEAGFGNTESFSKAFLKITGIKPSYFIKQLQKRLDTKL